MGNHSDAMEDIELVRLLALFFRMNDSYMGERQLEGGENTGYWVLFTGNVCVFWVFLKFCKPVAQTGPGC